MNIKKQNGTYILTVEAKDRYVFVTDNKSQLINAVIRTINAHTVEYNKAFDEFDEEEILYRLHEMAKLQEALEDLLSTPF